MAKKRGRGRKVRVDFRRNREQPGRQDDWTRRYHEDQDTLADERLTESVRAKGALSRKRTVILDADDTPVIDESQLKTGTITRTHGLISFVDDDTGRAWPCTVRRVLRSILIQQRSSVTVGDRVWFSVVSESDTGDERVGVIERVAARKTTLSRRDRRKREHTLVANADQLLIVASVAEPGLKPHLIDRYLIAALKGALRPVICFNKMDLLEDAPAVRQVGDAKDNRSLQSQSDSTPQEDATATLSAGDLIQEFRDLGYCCIPTSVVDGTGLDTLADRLRAHITVLSGQSGVGKSSLINAIQPGLDLRVAAVSAENEKGKHITSHAQLHRLDIGGYVVDTPGIRQFDLWSIAPGELEAGFVEFLPHIPNCRFGDCSHRHEKGCAVLAAVEADAISVRRYASYLKLFSEV